MSNEPAWVEPSPEAEPAPPNPDEYKQEVLRELQRLVRRCNELRLTLDALNVERGVPVKNTVARVVKATELLTSAKDYWQYDIIDRMASGTKAERQKQEAWELQ